MVEELLRVIYTLVKEMSHPKSPNLPSFWPLTPERKVRLTCAWSHFVGLIEFYLLEPFGKLPNMNRIYNKPKTSKLWICPFILLLMTATASQSSAGFDLNCFEHNILDQPSESSPHGPAEPWVLLAA